MNLIKALEDLLTQPPRCGTTHVIAIDGRAGSGKSTLAQELSLALGVHRTVEIIHLDEIYCGWDRALSESLTESLAKIIRDVLNKSATSLSIFNWSKMEFDTERKVLPCELLIIEGVGSAQEIVRKYCTATIWLDVDAEIGIHRVLERDGMEILIQMRQWQLAENAHFLADRTRESADFILST